MHTLYGRDKRLHHVHRLLKPLGDFNTHVLQCSHYIVHCSKCLCSLAYFVRLFRFFFRLTIILFLRRRLIHIDILKNVVDRLSGLHQALHGLGIHVAD